MSFAFTTLLPLSRYAVDRDHAARSDPALFESLWADGATRVLPLWRGKALIAYTAEAPRLVLLPPERVPRPARLVYLGLSLPDDGAEPAGTPLVAAALTDEEALALEPDETRWVGLRGVAIALSDRDSGAFAEALGVLNWHESHSHCPRCGAETRVENGGWTRRCPVCGSQVFPRTDPAVIVLITDRSDRILLGSNALWETDRYSLLAGFVEPGESLEAAVIREMFEESGLRVTDPVYLGSQPWPFPASIMCGFTATLADDQQPHDLLPDGTEILDLRWFSREELWAELQNIILPGPSSIARAMVEQWLGESLGRRPGMVRVSLTPESLLAGLDDQQRVAAEALIGPVCMLAGAGTGKTRAITHRIAYGVATGAYAPSRVMALTFTARAAAELRGRLRQLGAGGVAARTFHAAALSQLNYFWPHVVGGQAPRILDGKGRLLGHAAESLGLKVDTATLRDLAAEIEWRKTSGLGIDAYAVGIAGRGLPGRLDVDQVVAMQEAYERLKDERKQIDFEDVLLAMAGHDRGGAVRRPAGARAVPLLRRRRVPGRVAAAARPARALAGRTPRPLRGGRREPDHLLLRGRTQRLPARLSQTLRGRDRGAARAELPVDAAHRGDREPAHAGPAGRPVAARGGQRDRP